MAYAIVQYMKEIGADNNMDRAIWKDGIRNKESIISGHILYNM